MPSARNAGAPPAQGAGRRRPAAGRGPVSPPPAPDDERLVVGVLEGLEEVGLVAGIDGQPGDRLGREDRQAGRRAGQGGAVAKDVGDARPGRCLALQVQQDGAVVAPRVRRHPRVGPRLDVARRRHFRRAALLQRHDGPAALPDTAILRPRHDPRGQNGQQDHDEPRRRPRQPDLEQDVDQDRHIHREHDDVGMRQVRPGDRAERLVEPRPGQGHQPRRDRDAPSDPRARGDQQDRAGNRQVVPVHALVDHHVEHAPGRELVVRPAVGDDPDTGEEVGPEAVEPERQEAQRDERGD